MASGERDAEIVLLPNIRRDPELFLCLAVVALQIIVIDWPINESFWTVWVAFSHLEIGRHKPQASAQPVRCTARDAVIGAPKGSCGLAVVLFLVLNEVAFLWIGAVFSYCQDARPTGRHFARVVDLWAKQSRILSKRPRRVRNFRALERPP